MASNAQKNMTGLIFSKDRAMQLRAVIESLLLHCADHTRIQLCVLYKTSGELHRRQYDRLRDEFCDVSFIEEVNFKEQVLEIIGESKHVMFLVDDNLFVRDFLLAAAVKALADNRDALGFSLRLGANTAYCYAHDIDQNAPAFRQIDDEITKYDWTHAEYDFGYPLEISSSIYRTTEIIPLLKQVNFSNPNTLEGAMAANARLYREARSTLLCFEQSVTFCAPLNMVQTVWRNRAGKNSNHSAEKLAEMYARGRRIDVVRYSGFVPNACHQEVELYFDRGTKPERPNLARRDSGPGFSIVMANYNNARYMTQAIESVLRQTFTDWELIIVDDCSTDNSEAVSARYLRDKRIRLIRHEANRGYTAALKTGIGEVRSAFFGILDSDDALTTEALETMHRWHLRFPDCGFLYSQFAFCDENLKPGKNGFCAEIPPGRTSLDVNAVSHFKTFKLRDYLRTAGYDEDILYAEDLDIIYKMEEVTGMKFVDQCLYLYRERPNSLCRAPEKINVAIMSRVKARVNALRRRCRAQAGQNNQDFYRLFAHAVEKAGAEHPDVEQYFEILARLYGSGMLANISWPTGAEKWGQREALLWLAANVDIQFDRLFELLARNNKVEAEPLISIEMAAYNAERFIGRAIDSLLAQTYRNFELVIVDDGSTDRTADIIASYTDHRIRYFPVSHKNCAAARNRAIDEAKGEYLLCVDSDDYIAPDYIEKMVACARMHPEIDYFYPSRLQPVDASGRPTGEQWRYLDFSDNRTLPQFLLDKGYGPIPNPGSLKRKALFERTGGYDDVDSIEDFVFICKNALKIRFMRVENHDEYFYTRLPSGSSHNFEARDRIMADVLNEMVSLYKAETLCPQLAGISDTEVKRQQYYKHLIRTFHRHAEADMVEYGEHFRKYGDYYRGKMRETGELCETAVPT